jgi:hypothetical protein
VKKLGGYMIDVKKLGGYMIDVKTLGAYAVVFMGKQCSYVG